MFLFGNRKQHNISIETLQPISKEYIAVIDIETMAVRLIDTLRDGYPEKLAERYKISDFEDLQSWEILEMIGRKRGMLISGGEVNTERASVMLLDEYRGGKLGRISMEFPDNF